MLMDRASFIVTSHKGASRKHLSFLETQLSNPVINTNSLPCRHREPQTEKPAMHQTIKTCIMATKLSSSPPSFF